MTTAADLSPAAVEACIELVREQRHGVSFPELRTVCEDLGVLTAGDAILGAAAIPGVVLWAENVRRVRRDRRCRPRAHLDWARRLPAPGPRRRGGVHPDAVAAYPRASWPPNPSGYRTPHYPPVAFAWRQPLPRRTEADRLHIPTERTSTVTDEPTADRARRLYDQIGWPMANEVFNRVAGDVPPGPIAIPPQPGKPPRFWPLGEGRIVTSPFGPRDGSFHAGTDFGRAGGSAGMPVYACQGGTVIYAGAAQGYGGPDPVGWLVIDHPTEDGSGCTEYGHIIREVAKGDRVAAGQRIGHINPDRATNGGVAPHLHLSVMPREYDPQAKMDPMPWLTGALEPGTARGDVVWLADVLRAEGLNVIEYSGWKTRHNGDHFDDVWGVVCHHTGSFNTTAATIANGRPDLDGPLSQIHLALDGTVTVVAAGCANHAGTGNWPGLGLHQGNRRAIGIEPAHDGKAAWSAAQRDAYVKCCAAINRKVGNDGSHTIAHWEYDDGDPATDEGKWDPGNLDMNRFRADVKARVASGGEDGLFMPNISANDAAIVVAAAKKIMAMWDNDDLSKRHAWSSRAIYRDDDNPVDDTIEMLLNTEGNAHDSQVEVEALMGNPTYIAKVRRLAEGKGPGAKNPDGSPNTDNISRARLVLKRCPDVTTGPAPEAPPSPAKKTTRKKKTAPTEQAPS